MKHKRKLRNRIKREVLHTIKKAKEKLERAELQAKFSEDLARGYVGNPEDYGMTALDFQKRVLGRRFDGYGMNPEQFKRRLREMGIVDKHFGN